MDTFKCKFRFSAISLVLLMLLTGPRIAFAGATPEKAAAGVLKRLLPEKVNNFTFQLIDRQGENDVFEIESAPDGKIVLRGSNGVSMCSALNWYLRNYVGAEYSWRGTQLNLPKTLPPVTEKVRIVSPFQYRYCFNFCAFSYSLAWFDWDQWQQIIDWMAMNGINMPLAVTGEEAVWQGVARRLGISDKAMSEFFVGPGYLPFGWMGCIDGFGGPLPQSWIDSHKELQKKILARERELGMTPVLQGFTGHVPAALKEKYPDSKLKQLPSWCGFPGTHFVDPADPLFQKIGKVFVEEQTRLYGTDHLYAADTFIEMPPPSNDPEFLHQMGKSVYGAMTVADPEAIWVMQGWLFVNAPNFWKPPQAKALFSAVPDDKMIVIDLNCEIRPTWQKTEAFYGKQWLWCIIQNFGDIINFHAGLPQIAEGLVNVTTDSNRGKLSGAGYIMEGLGYAPVVYTLMTQLMWKPETLNVEEWVADYARIRYGQKSENAEKAWQLLLKSACNYPKDNHAEQIVTRPPRIVGDKPYDSTKVAGAADMLLACADELGGVDAYHYDLVITMHQAMSNMSRSMALDIKEAYTAKDAKALEAAGEKYLELMRDMDDLLATREEFLLGKWLEDAKRWATNEQERKLYEFNARNIITLWGPRDSMLHEYANKHWSGLIKDFYLPRWEMYINDLKQSLVDGTEVNKSDLNNRLKDWEVAWTHRTEKYPAYTQGCSVKVAERVWAKYRDLCLGKDSQSLTTGKPVSCSTHIGTYVAELANDGQCGNTNSYWAMDTKSGHPAWWKVDLEEPTDVSRVVVVCYYGDQRYYGFTVETSLDGKTWQIVADWRDNKKPSTSRGYTCKFKPHKVRYIRVNQTHSSANTGRHLVEVMAYQ